MRVAVKRIPARMCPDERRGLTPVVGLAGHVAYMPVMSTLFAILIVIAMAATAYVLVKGVIAMASGKDIGGVKQQKAMRQRVFYQAIAIVLVMLFLLIARSNG